MPSNPFNTNEGSSLEQGLPVSKVTKQVTNAAASQVKATNQSLVDQLYGNVASQNESGEAVSQAATQGQKATTSQALPSTATGNPADEAQLAETRRKLQELQKQHNEKYVEPTFGEAAQKKRKQQEAQEKQLKEQQEQEEEERKAQEKAQQEQEVSGQAQGKGRNRMSQPISVTQAKTKTEINRGSSG